MTTQIKRPVFFSGENPGMTLYQPGTEQPVAVASYWICTDSLWGVGHALVLWLDTKFGQGGVFTDNPGLAQTLVNDLTQYFPEFREVPTQTLTYVEAQCGHQFDGISYQVLCQTPDLRIEIEWTEILDRKQIVWPEFPAGKAVYDLTTVICTCRVGRIRINGRLLAGETKTAQTASSSPSSSAFLAFAETWIGPLDKTGKE